MSKQQGNATVRPAGRDGLLGPVATCVADTDTGAWRDLTPVLTGECTRCGICRQHCPLAVIRVGQARLFTVDLRFCKGCGICAQVCPRRCISMLASSGRED